MSRKIYVLRQIEGREEREKLRSERIRVIIKVDIEVAGSLMMNARCSSRQRPEESKLIQ